LDTLTSGGPAPLVAKAIRAPSGATQKRIR
jgi:hypothetical protein